jgi:hypothetical protein
VIVEVHTRKTVLIGQQPDSNCQQREEPPPFHEESSLFKMTGHSQPDLFKP